MKRYNVYLTDKQMEALKALSQRTGLSVSEHMRRAVDAYLHEQPDVMDLGLLTYMRGIDQVLNGLEQLKERSRLLHEQEDHGE
ncbi:MAG TPA: ribbon-helix-helix protein, CopG family [Anaerolineae bacterium]|nr:ribbon-helix-helix protein, CopG family [Anaerolineae bacterium]